MKREFTQEELRTVLAGFGINDATDITRYGSGHINDTFKVETPARRFILQRINTSIFTDPDAMMHNISRVTAHIAAKGHETLEVLGYANGWRVYKFIEGARTYDVLSEPAQAFKIGAAFARFQNDLADLPAPRLNETIPNFHNALTRLAALDAALTADVKGRAAQCAPELEFVAARRAAAGRIVAMMASGEIPERITHNDTKLNNVMLDDATGEGRAVIDLDTVMPGSALYDFGDMVRTSTANAAEDERDLAKVFSRADMFEQLARGYLSQAKFLAVAERANLVFSGELITFVIGVRFLTDFLAGDTYFRTAYPDHNLIRARTQFKMVSSIESQHSAYQSIIDSL